MEPSKPKSLVDQIEIQADGIVSRSLLKKAGGNITLFSFANGQGLSEHSTPYEAALFLLEGELVVQIGSEEMMVQAGDYLGLPAGIPHAVRATADARMLLIMLKD